ncbi:Magnetosome protein MamI [Candidatus Desulfarcum epimagneticum]|uniref:Magnetosome protein MamI n=1 Tax=uncultured Desulfobacteraceae bacterium TaxID=218296 RepID=A0A484HKJ2_9BACT|nr:Magnetosome protein MamI [uncultured Desulfobacteraceae bacterium]
MISIVSGLFFIALGIWGIFDEYYYVADFLRGFGPVALMLCGLVAALAGFMPIKPEEETDV